MDLEIKKRSRESSSSPADQQPPAKRHGAATAAAACAADVIKASAASPLRSVAERPVGVFEFPWQKKAAAAYWEGSDVRDVFFSSLVDGCSAAIGHPGDRLFLAPARIVISDGEGGIGWAADGGVDGIWSCALSQPLTALERESSSA